MPYVNISTKCRTLRHGMQLMRQYLDDVCSALMYACKNVSRWCEHFDEMQNIEMECSWCDSIYMTCVLLSCVHAKMSRGDVNISMTFEWCEHLDDVWLMWVFKWHWNDTLTWIFRWNAEHLDATQLMWVFGWHVFHSDVRMWKCVEVMWVFF